MTRAQALETFAGELTSAAERLHKSAVELVGVARSLSPNDATKLHGQAAVLRQEATRTALCALDARAVAQGLSTVALFQEVDHG